MPIKSITEIADFAEYKKALKRDLELAKSKLQPFIYIEGYKFTGKVGPAIIVGKIEASVIQAFKNNGTALSFSKGRCRYVKSTVNFVVDQGPLVETKLVLARNFAGLNALDVAVSEGLVETRAEDVGALQTALTKAVKAQVNPITTTLTERYQYLKAQKVSGAPVLSKEDDRALLALFAKARDAAKEDPLGAYDPLVLFEDALAVAEAKAGLVVDRLEIAPNDAVKEAFQAYAEAAEAQNKQIDEALPRDRPTPKKLVVNTDVGVVTEVGDKENPETVTQRSVGQMIQDRGEALEFQKKQVEEHEDGAKKLAAVKLMVTARREELGRLLAEPKRIIEESIQTIESHTRTVENNNSEIDSRKETYIDAFVEVEEGIRKRYKDDVPEMERRIRVLETNRDDALRENQEMIEENDRLGLEVPELEKTVKAQKKLAKEIIERIWLGLQSDIEDRYAGFGSQYPTTLPKLKDVLENSAKGLPEAEEAVRDFDVLAGRHGSGRHGAQTGIEMQARRVATRGVTADQDENEYGTSRGGSTKWRAITLTWENKKGKKVITDRAPILKEILRQHEHRLTPASASSSFHSPELEREAVERAVAIATAAGLQWKEISTQDGTGWEPLQDMTIIIGKPKKSRSVGWGLSLEQIKTEVKLELADANRILDDFRDGNIDLDTMLEGLNSKLILDGDGGAKMMTHARLFVQKTSKGWASTTHFPSADGAPSWSLSERWVRESDGVNVVEKPPFHEP